MRTSNRTSLELKRACACYTHFNANQLIETYGSYYGITSNRTSLELKRIALNKTNSSNRTSLELKLTNNVNASNRTSLELKHEPVWN